MNEKLIQNINGEKYKINNNVQYVEESFKVWIEDIARISDHRLVTCEISITERRPEGKINNQQEQEEIKENEIRNTEKIRWKREDKGDRKYWDRLKEGDVIMGEWCNTILLEEKVNNAKDYISQTVDKYQITPKITFHKQ